MSDFPAWLPAHPAVTARHLGVIPKFLSQSDQRPAREQFAERYIGGWLPTRGFSFAEERRALLARGDPPLRLLASTTLHETETILLYQHSWVAIVQPDGSFEVARVD